jgi:hypothetical protein
MRRKYIIDPVSPGIKFEFDKESTKDFGGMVVNRKPGQARSAEKKPQFRPANAGANRGVGGAPKKGGDVGIPERNMKKPTNRPARPARSRRMIP